MAIALALLIAACGREDRALKARAPTKVPAVAEVSHNDGRLPPLNARAAAYEHNANAIAQGQQLFTWMNCVGCHSHGGGGMGPPLMDDKWIYGGRIDQVAASIMNGRPRGMPAWRGKITEEQMWQLAAFVRSMSGQVRKDAVGARADEMSNTPPLTQTKREPMLPDSGGLK
jgi:cytochrome c oxidase cbb3-type subunit III